jgi:hypothetical protein
MNKYTYHFKPLTIKLLIVVLHEFIHILIVVPLVIRLFEVILFIIHVFIFSSHMHDVVDLLPCR